MEKKVTITLLGGGTGQSNILRGLKQLDVNINSIVTMADDGGSSGMLRQEMNISPPGDLRNCILALSNIEPEMERLFQYRFTKGSLKGQNFGNLFIAAMNDIYGDLKNAISQTSKILAVRGNVYPVTYDDINLSALLGNKNIAKGESNLAKEAIKQNTYIDRVYVNPHTAKASEDAIEAIRNSDIIIAGPGSLYTSIFPVLLVDGIKEEIIKSKAIKIFITNIMTEYGETDRFTSKDFLMEIIKNFETEIFDYFLVNSGEVEKPVLIKYKNKNQNMVKHTTDDDIEFKKRNIKVVNKDIVKIKNNLIFHNNKIVSKIVQEIYYKKFNKKLLYRY